MPATKGTRSSPRSQSRATHRAKPLSHAIVWRAGVIASAGSVARPAEDERCLPCVPGERTRCPGQDGGRRGSVDAWARSWQAADAFIARPCLELWAGACDGKRDGQPGLPSLGRASTIAAVIARRRSHVSVAVPRAGADQPAWAAAPARRHGPRAANPALDGVVDERGDNDNLDRRHRARKSEPAIASVAEDQRIGAPTEGCSGTGSDRCHRYPRHRLRTSVWSDTPSRRCRSPLRYNNAGSCSSDTQAGDRDGDATTALDGVGGERLPRRHPFARWLPW